jgi:hypothetical protein
VKILEEKVSVKMTLINHSFCMKVVLPSAEADHFLIARMEIASS